MSFTPISPNSPVSSVLPLSVVVAVTMVKELVEDWKRRKQDVEMNNRKTKVHRGNGNFEDTKWMDLRVGDIVKVEKDEYFPADLILLSSGYDEAICYVETTNLDGETNLKLKQALEVTLGLNEDSVFKNFRSVIRCEDPNAKLYSFIGSLDLGGQKHPLSSQQLRLRESKLRNTDYIFGVSIFTGHDTKVSQNSVDPPSKRSRIERRTDEFEGRTLRMCYAIPKRKKASPPAQLKPAVLYNLFVANLPFAARDQDLKELFKSGGSEVVSAEVIFNENPRRPSGYGFVSFKTKKEADEALTTFEGKELMGRSIRVARSKRFVKPESETNFQSEDGDDLPADSSDDSEQIETVDNL